MLSRQKISSNCNNENLRNLILYMDDFLPLGSISELFALNEFCRLLFILDFIVKNIFFELVNIIRDISYRKLVNFEYYFLLWSAMVRRTFNVKL